MLHCLSSAEAVLYCTEIGDIKAHGGRRTLLFSHISPRGASAQERATLPLIGSYCFLIPASHNDIYLIAWKFDNFDNLASVLALIFSKHFLIPSLYIYPIWHNQDMYSLKADHTFLVIFNTVTDSCTIYHHNVCLFLAGEWRDQDGGWQAWGSYLQVPERGECQYGGDG